MQLQRGCMPRPLAVWKRLTSRLEKAAASEIELKLALDTARSEVKEVCMERDQAVASAEAVHEGHLVTPEADMFGREVMAETLRIYPPSSELARRCIEWSKMPTPCRCCTCPECAAVQENRPPPSRGQLYADIVKLTEHINYRNQVAGSRP